MNTTLEISARTIGGPESYPRTWGPKVVDMPVHPSAIWYVHLTASTTASLFLEAQFSHWRTLDQGWLAALVDLRDVNGWSIGRRPALIYDRPYDVPTVTNFHVPGESLVFALSIRKHT